MEYNSNIDVNKILYNLHMDIYEYCHTYRNNEPYVVMNTGTFYHIIAHNESHVKVNICGVKKIFGCKILIDDELQSGEILVR